MEFQFMSPEQIAQLKEEISSTKNSNPRVIRFEENQIGRDFVIGDVHGAFDSVWQAMVAAGFHRGFDRLFSVGDLIDRGPGSARAAQFLSQPYVHAIQGNHEANLLELYRDYEDPEQGLATLARIDFNGMGWLANVSAAERFEVVQAIARLPLAIEVQTPRGPVGLIHAEVPSHMDWPTFVAALEGGDPEIEDSCLTGRERIKSGDTSGVPGIGRIFAGHSTSFQGAVQLGNVYMIDTGAVFAEIKGKPGAAMTMADLQFKTASLSKPAVHQGVQLLKENTLEPFGSYAMI
ncbi:MAG: metallophosphoesterase [Burkholderiaceae bacterium]|nr:MAG: metallophosphoesterase [Burkholderiaceae bacterium]TBR76820.1 MAG: metallophosphoesterase [Burkholderiaceae bacterium]